MKLWKTSRPALLSAVAAALLAACGGGESPAPSAQSPQSAQLASSPQSAAATEVRSTPVDSERKANGQAKTNKVYVIQLAEAPVTAYAGGVQGLQATKPSDRARNTNVDRILGTSLKTACPR